LELIPLGKRLRGKDVFLEKHAFTRVRDRGISLDMIYYTLKHPHEIYRENRYKPLLPNMKRYVAIRVIDDKVNIVVYDENENIIVITSWNMKTIRRFNRYKEKKIKSKSWTRIR